MSMGSGTTKFSTINDGSLVARTKAGTYIRDGLEAVTFATYERDPNILFCTLDVCFLPAHICVC